MTAVLESAEYGETRKKLIADPAIQLMAAELESAIEAGHVRRDQLQHKAGSPTWDFMSRALDEWHTRTRTTISTHIGGPAEAVLVILDGAAV